MTSACILGVIVRKLGHRQESCPVILFEVDKGSKVCHHRAVLLFGLTVRLRMERGGKSPFNSEEVIKR